MNKKDLKNNSFVINENTSIQQAMKAITDNKRGTVVVVDDEFYFTGIVSDGDIRRAIVSGMTTIAPVSKIVNFEALTVDSDTNTKLSSSEIFEEHVSVNLVPVVDKNNKLVDLFVRDSDSIRSKLK